MRLGIREARLGIREARLGIRDARLGIREARLGIREARLGIRDASKMSPFSSHDHGIIDYVGRSSHLRFCCHEVGPKVGPKHRLIPSHQRFYTLDPILASAKVMPSTSRGTEESLAKRLVTRDYVGRWWGGGSQ